MYNIMVTCLLLACCTAYRHPLRRHQAYSIHFAAQTDNLVQTDSLVDKVATFLDKSTIQEIISRDEAYKLLDSKDALLALLSNGSVEIDKYIDKIVTKGRADSRSIREIIGEGACEKALQAVDGVNIYDRKMLNSLLKNEVVESIIANILYEGIFEFIQRVDLIGNIINNLPVLGPIRASIVKEFKRNLDLVLGGQLKSFLASYNRVAIDRVIIYILSEDNRPMFKRGARGAAANLLKTPVSSLLPTDETVTQLVTAARALVLDTKPEDLRPSVNFMYDLLGDKGLRDLNISASDALKSSEELKGIIRNIVHRIVC